MSRSVVGIYLAHVRRFAHYVYLRNKANEKVESAEISKISPKAPQCYQNWLKEVDKPAPDPATLVLDSTEYKRMLQDRYDLVSGRRQDPLTIVNYGYKDVYPTTWCQPEKSHVPYFEALWRRKC